jgi:hypothetical protein
MSSRYEDRKLHQKDTCVQGIYPAFRKINENVNVDDRLKRRSRNGGYIAWKNVPANATDEELRRSSRNGGYVALSGNKSQSSASGMNA